MSAKSDEAAFAAAHKEGNTETMIALYIAQADALFGQREEAFYLTQAYVLALEGGLPTDTLLARLRALNCEA